VHRPATGPSVRLSRHRHEPGAYPSRRRLGLRSSVTLGFAGGALALSAVLSIGTYLVARDYLVAQRERTVLGQAFADASYVRAGLLTSGTAVSAVLGEVSPSADATVFVHRSAEWYSTSLLTGSDVVPVDLQELVSGGEAGLAWTEVDGSPALAVGVPVPAVGAQFYEVTGSGELDQTLETLATVLLAFAVLTTIGGALVGRWSAHRALAPLDAVAGTAARIAAGDFRTRLPATDDPDLVTIVGSFNRMVDALHERIERDARFTADVSHELRSPLTTLTTSVELLQRRREQLSPAAQEALDLASAELRRFRTALDDLLELGRIDAVGTGQPLTPVDVWELVRQALVASGRSERLLEPNAGRPLRAAVDKQRLNRALVNLFDNADLHGGGLSAVTVRQSGSAVTIEVDDAGPGVPVEERDRIFERFVRGGSRRSLPGAGLGLSLVSETVRIHGGRVTCTERPGGGARFTVWLPPAAGPGVEPEVLADSVPASR
jgi:two-component system sensor histidine kinase MtrB